MFDIIWAAQMSLQGGLILFTNQNPGLDFSSSYQDSWFSYSLGAVVLQIHKWLSNSYDLFSFIYLFFVFYCIKQST